MRIVMIFPGLVGYLPPAVTAAVALHDCGDDVFLIAGGCETPTRRILSERGVKCLDIGMQRYPWSALGKATLRLRFGVHLWSALRVLRPQVVWYHGAHAMEYLSLARRLAPAALTVAHAHELYDEHKRLRASQERAIKASTCWIVPDQNRESLLSAVTRSKAPRWIVPNRPLETLAGGPNSGRETLELFRRRGGSAGCTRLVIYQGLIAESRCVLEAVEAFQRTRRPDLGLIILGECRDRRYAVRLRAAVKGDGRIVVLDRIAPPLHLRVTMGADVGILLYAPTSLNNLFCAPNKLFEYAWCGLGVVIPAFPPLIAATEPFGFGSSADPRDASSIARALEHELDRAPVARREAAAAFLEASGSPVGIYAGIRTYLNDLSGPTGCRSHQPGRARETREAIDRRSL